MRTDWNEIICNELKGHIVKLEEALNADVISYYGVLQPGIDRLFRDVIEDLKTEKNKRDKVYILLTTPGGSAETVQVIVNVLRYHYKEVNFIIPQYAYSAGTILCMSGDNIFMDYFSQLGPIDPQVKSKEGKFVPALGYLDKVEEFLVKAKNNTLTDAEFVILKNLDLAELRAYEQAKNLTIDLIKEWLTKYKFKNWETHSSTHEPVTNKDKEERAKQIAGELANSKKWCSHSRPIDINALTKMKLKIEDLSQCAYNNQVHIFDALQDDYIRKNNRQILFCTRRVIVQ